MSIDGRSCRRQLLDFAIYMRCFRSSIAGPIVRYGEIETGARCGAATRSTSFADGASTGSASAWARRSDRRHPGCRRRCMFGLPADELATGVAWLGTLCLHPADLLRLLRLLGHGDRPRPDARLHVPGELQLPLPCAQSITEFWRRWHMTLSRWFRDYLYIPLGGNRRRPSRTYRNLLIVFFLCGLWHGAAWTFVVWGLYPRLLADRWSDFGSRRLLAPGRLRGTRTHPRRDGRLGVLPRPDPRRRMAVPVGDVSLRGGQRGTPDR